MDYYDDMSEEEIYSIINNINICILSVIDNNKPYSIPVNYIIKRELDSTIIEIKTKIISKKINCCKNNHNVSLLFIKNNHEGIESIIGNGTVIKIEDGIISIKIDNFSGRCYYN